MASSTVELTNMIQCKGTYLNFALIQTFYGMAVLNSPV